MAVLLLACVALAWVLHCTIARPLLRLLGLL